MRTRDAAAAGVLLAATLIACGDSGDDPEDLTVTLLSPVFDEHVQRCGNLDGNSIALEDAGGSLLVPAVHIQGEAPVEGELATPAGVASRWCETTVTLTDVPHHDVYQLVYTAGSTVYRAGYRYTELEEAGWQLEGLWRDVLKSP